MRRIGLGPRLPCRLLWLPAALIVAAAPAYAQTVRFADKPTGLVSGPIEVAVDAAVPVERLELFINGVPHSEAEGRRLTARINASLYIRRLRLRAVGYDAEGRVAGEDEMVVNDPRPPF